VGTGEVRADTGAAKAGNRLAVVMLGFVAFAQQRLGARLEPDSRGRKPLVIFATFASFQPTS
jgi:hypothetical protein